MSIRKGLEGVEVVGIRSRLVEGVVHSSEDYNSISKEFRDGRASIPTGNSLAGVGTAVVDLRILRDTRRLGNLTCLVDGSIFEQEGIVVDDCLLSATRREANSSVALES